MRRTNEPSENEPSAMPIEQIIDRQGHVLHDCELAGCDVSWDGVDRKSGAPVAGAPGVDPARVQVAGKVARLREPAPK